MSKTPVITDRAPAAIGPYSQAIKAGGACYISGQIGLDPATGEMVPGGIDAQIVRVFDNLMTIAAACGGTLAHAVKVNVYLTDLANFAKVNEVMANYFGQPYPARAAGARRSRVRRTQPQTREPRTSAQVGSAAWSRVARLSAADSADRWRARMRMYFAPRTRRIVTKVPARPR